MFDQQKDDSQQSDSLLDDPQFEATLETKLLHPDAEQVSSVREGVVALQSGDLKRAHDVFSELTDTYYTDENVWIGLALSSDNPDEARGAVRNAELINPASRYVQRAMRDVAQRFPSSYKPEMDTSQPVAPPPPSHTLEPFAGLRRADAPVGAGATSANIAQVSVALSSSAALKDPHGPVTVNQLSERPAALVSKPRRRIGRIFASLLLFLLLVGILAGSAYELWNSAIFQTPLQATPQPVAIVAPTETATPQVVAPPIAQGTATTAATQQAAALSRNEAIQAVNDGRFAEAIPVLLQLSKSDPSDSEALYYLGIAYMSTPGLANGAEQASTAFQQVIAARPDWAPGFYMLAQSFLLRGMAREAIPPAQKATQLDPAKSEYWLVLAEAYQGNGQPNEAEAAQTHANMLLAAGVTTETPADASIAGVFNIGSPQPESPTPTTTDISTATETPMLTAEATTSSAPADQPAPTDTALPADTETATPVATDTTIPDAVIMQATLEPADPNATATVSETVTETLTPDTSGTQTETATPEASETPTLESTATETPTSVEGTATDTPTETPPPADTIEPAPTDTPQVEAPIIPTDTPVIPPTENASP